MRCTALPLRVTADGRLEQQEGLDAVLELVKIMAGTTSTTWPHAPWFGLLEAFQEAAHRERQDQESLKDAINTALKELGVSWLSAYAVTTGGFDPQGRRTFQMTFHDRSGQVLFGALAAQ